MLSGEIAFKNNHYYYFHNAINFLKSDFAEGFLVNTEIQGDSCMVTKAVSLPAMLEAPSDVTKNVWLYLIHHSEYQSTISHIYAFVAKVWFYFVGITLSL